MLKFYELKLNKVGDAEVEGMALKLNMVGDDGS
jgi:hypothetical protein